MEQHKVSKTTDRLHMTVSKLMTRILRHHPPAEVDDSGWVPLPVLISLLRMKPSEADIRAIVAADDKGRFDLDDSTDPPRIRATQGHSYELPTPVLHPVEDAGSVPAAVHVTSEDGWKAIQEDGELRRMSRTHIHFATQPNHQRKNHWACVLLLLDLRAAMEAGLEFCLSTNGVLLAKGPVPLHFLRHVEPRELNRLRASDTPDGGGDGGGDSK